jgi:hypothetical protein
MAVAHCWQDRREFVMEVFGPGSDEHELTWADGWRNGTCMLLDGHAGPHEFEDDEDITLQFAPLKPYQ